MLIAISRSGIFRKRRGRNCQRCSWPKAKGSKTRILYFSRVDSTQPVTLGPTTNCLVSYHIRYHDLSEAWQGLHGPILAFSRSGLHICNPDVYIHYQYNIYICIVYMYSIFAFSRSGLHICNPDVYIHYQYNILYVQCIRIHVQIVN